MSSVPHDQRLGADPDVVEVDVGGPGPFLAHLGVLGTDFNSCRVRGNQEDRDTGALLVGRPGPRENHEQTGDRCIGDEALLPGYHPIAAVPNGFGA